MTASAWHELCKLRDDIRTGALTLAEFTVTPKVVRHLLLSEI